MDKLIYIACVLGITSVAHAEDFYENTPAAWKHFEIRGVQLGTPMASLKGFTCTERAKRHEYNANCYKLMDTRCNTGHCVLKEDKVMGEQWWELNGTKTSLDIMVVTLNDTKSSLVYEINLRLGPSQLLTQQRRPRRSSRRWPDALVPQR
jgi:hypothetical protein